MNAVLRLAAVALALSGSATWARADVDPDTLVVAPPAPQAAPVPLRIAAGADGTWYPVPIIPAVTLEAPAGVAPDGSNLPRLLADIGGRQAHTIVYDPVRQRFVAFGGMVQPGGLLFNDLWERPLASTSDWTPLTTGGITPAARSGHSAVYDPVGDRMIVFGGASPTLLNDVWQLNLGGTPQWSPLPTTGTPPLARSGHSAVFDAARNRMLVFGGQTPTVSNEVWSLDFTTAPATWRLLTPTGTPPPGRIEHVAILDATHDQMVIFGGLGATYYQDVWALSLGASPFWQQRLSTSAPGPRDAASAVYDPTGNQMVLFGGRFFSTHYADVWLLQLSSLVWSTSALAGPSARRLAAMAIDPTSRTAILHGGIQGSGSSDIYTWKLALSPPAWTNVAPSQGPPPPPPPPPPPGNAAAARRYSAAAVFDSQRGRYLMLGGAYDMSAARTYLSDISEFVIGRDSAWIEVESNAAFGGRFGHSAIYDPTQDRIIVYGGYNGSYLGDLWEIRLSPAVTVAPLTATGTGPGPRDYHTAIYDPIRKRMVVFGGNNNGNFMNDLWELRLAGTPTWAPLFFTGPPPSPRLSHRTVYDPYGDRMLVYGGYSFGLGTLGDLWALSLSGIPAWTPITPIGSPPAPRHSHSFQLDPTRQRAILYGGVRAETELRYYDTWELSLSGGFPAWRPLAPAGTIPPARYGHLALIDPLGDRMLVSGGADNGTLSDMWRLQWSQDVPTATAVALAGSDARPDEVELHWTLADGAGALCRIERRTPESEWRTLDTVSPGGSLVTFHDRQVTPGSRYGYRLIVIRARRSRCPRRRGSTCRAARASRWRAYRPTRRAAA